MTSVDAHHWLGARFSRNASRYDLELVRLDGSRKITRTTLTFMEEGYRTLVDRAIEERKPRARRTLSATRQQRTLEGRLEADIGWRPFSRPS